MGEIGVGKERGKGGEGKKGWDGMTSLDTTSIISRN